MVMARKGKAASLLDSSQYHNALRVNFVETNRLQKVVRAISVDQERVARGRERRWENTQLWRQDLQKSTGNADLKKYDNLLTTKTEDDDTVPEFYFLYGRSIGERPKLMKNFLGNQRKQSQAKEIKHTKEADTDQQENFDEVSVGTESKSITEPNQYNQIMIENQVVTQVPIGYRKSSMRKQNWHTSCTSEGMKAINTRIPEYYKLKHKYVLPPVNMFR